MIALLLALASAISLPGSFARAADESGSEFQSARLKTAIADSQRRLGELEPYQKRIFNEEVVPHAQRFVKNYGATGSGLAIDIDLPAIRDYLSFYAPVTLKQSDPKLLVTLTTDASCAKCGASIAPLKKLVSEQVGRRGFHAIWSTPADLGEQTTPKGIETRVQALAKEKGAGSYLLLNWRPQAADDIDSAHADEKRYFTQLALRLPGDIEQGARLEILENDSFEVGTSKLLTEAFAALGAREKAIASASEHLVDSAGGNEVRVELTGLQDFAQYTRLKTELQAKLAPEHLKLEERKVARGTASFGVRTNRSVDDVRAKIGDLALPAGVSANFSGVAP